MQVKFIKGTLEQYNAGVSTYSTNGSIFFVTDNPLIYVAGVAYGISTADSEKLNASVSGVTLNASDNTIKVSYNDSTKADTYVTLAAVSADNNGLMTPAQKSSLESVVEQVTTGGDGTLKNKVGENQVESTDKSITVTNGSTSEGVITKTNLSVNVDGTTIVKNGSTGVLSVASSALTQYVGDSATISVSAENNGNKTISSTIKLKEVTSNLASTTLKAYALVDSTDTEISGCDRIIVPKDSAFVDAFKGHDDDTVNTSTGVVTSGTGADALVYKYVNAAGVYSLVAINIAEYLKEAEFGAGLNVSDGSVAVKLSANTESAKYLKLQTIDGANDAIEVSGIDAAIAAASSSIAAKTTGHVTVASTTTDSGTTYTISESDIASAQSLSNEVTRAGNAEAALDTVLGTVKTANSETRTYTNTGTYIGQESTNTVASDIAALDTALNTLSGNTITGVNVNSVAATVSSGTASVTIDSDDIKVDGTTHTLLNTGGSVYLDDSVKTALHTIEAMLLWYEA